MKKYYIWIILLFIMMSCATPDKIAKRNPSQQRIERLLVKYANRQGKINQTFIPHYEWRVFKTLSKIEDSLVQVGLLNNKYNPISYLHFSEGLQDTSNRRIFLDIIKYFDPYSYLYRPSMNSTIPGNLYALYDAQTNKYPSLTLLWNLLQGYIWGDSVPTIEDYKPYLENISDVDFRKPIYRFPLLMNNFLLWDYSEN